MTEIEVIDPSHPLFGRRFAFLSMSTPLQGDGHVCVVYRDHMTLRIPRSATSLAEPRQTFPTKLTLPALTELISLVKQCEVLCHTNQKKSGDACPPNSKTKSARTLRRSSRR